jgi:hypothetical protein
MKNKKIKLTKTAWVNAGIKSGYLKDNKSRIELKKEALWQLATGLAGGALGAAGNWIYDKYKAGDWKERLIGYGIPQEKVVQMKQEMQKVDSTLANLKGISPELDKMIQDFKSQTAQSLQRAEQENISKGRGSGAMYGQQMLNQQQQQQQQQGQGQQQQGQGQQQGQQTQAGQQSQQEQE